MSPTTTSNWTSINAIYFRFQKHRNDRDYPDAHDLLNITYARFIPNLDYLFEDGASRTVIKQNVVDIIRAKIIKEIKKWATDTIDNGLIAECIKDLPMISQIGNDQLVCIKEAADMEHVLNIASNNSNFVTLFLDIGDLTFKNTATSNTDQFNPKRFEDIRKGPPSVASSGTHLLPVRQFLLIKRLEDIPGIEGGIRLVATFVQYVFNVSRVERVNKCEPNMPESKYFAYRFNDFAPSPNDLGFRRMEISDCYYDEDSKEKFPLWRSTFSGKIPMETETLLDVFPFKIVKVKLHIELNSSFVDNKRVRPALVLSKKQEHHVGEPKKRDKPLITCIQPASDPQITDNGFFSFNQKKNALKEKLDQVQRYELVSPYPRAVYYFDKKKNYCPRYTITFVMKNKGIDKQIATILPLFLVSIINTYSFLTLSSDYLDEKFPIQEYDRRQEAVELTGQHLALASTMAIVVVFLLRNIYEPSVKSNWLTMNNIYLILVFLSLILSAIPDTIFEHWRPARKTGVILFWISFIFPINNIITFKKLVNEYVQSDDDVEQFEKGSNFLQWDSDNDPFSKFFVKLEKEDGESLKHQGDLKDNGYEVYTDEKDWRVCYGT